METVFLGYFRGLRSGSEDLLLSDDDSSIKSFNILNNRGFYFFSFGFFDFEVEAGFYFDFSD